MATTEILLVKPVEYLGMEGEKVTVKAGYARNYLLPNRLAVPLTRANRKQIEALQKVRSIRMERELADAEELGQKLRKVHVAIPVKTGPGGKLFGSVTSADIQKRLEEDNISLDRKKIPLAAPIKTLGKHSIKIKLHEEVEVDFEIEVVSENPIE